MSISTAESISWTCKSTWKKASVNTLWCLLGCSIGDFGTIFFFQITQIPSSFMDNESCNNKWIDHIHHA